MATYKKSQTDLPFIQLIAIPDLDLCNQPFQTATEPTLEKSHSQKSFK